MKSPFSFCVLALCSAFVFSLPHHLQHSGDTPRMPGSAHNDLITSLPGLSSTSITQYAGMLDLPGTSKHLFYWYIQAESEPENKPLVFWTNGGPGCSGLIGFFTEHGPFRPLQNGTMVSNPYSWHKLANMVYMEQPAGVGFSYSDDEGDYVIGDQQTALDHYAGIKQFLQRFSEMMKNELYITSESYGGHYMPNLAREFLREGNTTINFKGFMVGNPLTDMVENAKGMYSTLFGHQIVSQPVYQVWLQKCSNGEAMASCDTLEAKMNQMAAPLDPYAITYPVCHDSAKAGGRAQRVWLLNHIHHNRPAIRDALGLIPPRDYEPCEADFTHSYLNQQDVQEAIHAPLGTKWEMCSNIVEYNTSDVAQPMESVYQYILANSTKLKILVFSGDDDTVCGTIGTQSWLWTLGLKEKESWRAWDYEDYKYGTQTGGFQVKFDGLTFATVHGAGHEVPAYRPQVGFKLFERYLSGDLH